ncbi:hypothetical protein HK405_005493 [Cladochytrium tenue]|nr:hypothetical protein HK405_005493 [Cladochytrium tenue]
MPSAAAAVSAATALLASLAAILGGGVPSPVAALKASGTPVGYAKVAGVVGGGDLTPIVPTTNAELVAALAGSTPRVVQLTKVFDFTTAMGTITEQGCAPWSCTPNPQRAINKVNYCSGQPASTVTYYAQALTPLDVGSNITIIGSGSTSGLKGVGLRMSSSYNVIVQNIRITDLNAEFVWGGDAITVVGSTGVWVDHIFTQNIGRMHLVMGYTPSTGVTFSNNELDGATTFSPYCNGKSYWMMLFVGINDFFTVANNYIHDSSGRGPHIGGTAGYFQHMHLVNNLYSNVDGHALDPELGSLSLAEGNVFTSVTTPITTDMDGKAYVPLAAADASACSASLGRVCQTNLLTGSGALVRTDAAALSAFSAAPAVASFSPMPVASVSAYVLANAGVGKITSAAAAAAAAATTSAAAAAVAKTTTTTKATSTSAAAAVAATVTTRAKPTPSTAAAAAIAATTTAAAAIAGAADATVTMTSTVYRTVTV